MYRLMSIYQPILDMIRVSDMPRYLIKYRVDFRARYASLGMVFEGGGCTSYITIVLQNLDMIFSSPGVVSSRMVSKPGGRVIRDTPMLFTN